MTVGATFFYAYLSATGGGKTVVQADGSTFTRPTTWRPKGCSGSTRSSPTSTSCARRARGVGGTCTAIAAIMGQDQTFGGRVNGGGHRPGTGGRPGQGPAGRHDGDARRDDHLARRDDEGRRRGRIATSLGAADRQSFERSRAEASSGTPTGRAARWPGSCSRSSWSCCRSTSCRRPGAGGPGCGVGGARRPPSRGPTGDAAASAGGSDRRCCGRRRRRGRSAPWIQPRRSPIRHRLRRRARDVRPVVAATHPPARTGRRSGAAARSGLVPRDPVGRAGGPVEPTILAIRSALAPFRRRLWLRRAVRRTWWVVAALLIAEAVLWTIARIVPFERAPYVALALPIAGLLLLAVLVLRARPSIGEAALAVDAEAGLRDRVSSALALAPSSPTMADAPEAADDPAPEAPARPGHGRRAPRTWIPSSARSSSRASGPMRCARLASDPDRHVPSALVADAGPHHARRRAPARRPDRPAQPAERGDRARGAHPGCRCATGAAPRQGRRQARREEPGSGRSADAARQGPPGPGPPAARPARRSST